MSDRDMSNPNNSHLSQTTSKFHMTRPLQPTTSPPSSLQSSSFIDTSSTLKHPVSSHSTFPLRHCAHVLTNALNSGRLGQTNPAEPDDREYTIFRRFWATFPWTMMFLQTVWSGAITGVVYAHARSRAADGVSALTFSFWTSHLVLSPSVVYAVGWALFILLGFQIREASGRYRDALLCWGRVAAMLKMVLRHMVQGYPRGVWHDGDHDRILAFLVAYPIALKMQLRDERERLQLESILHPSDVEDVIAAPNMAAYCIQVIRAYFSSAEVDQEKPFIPQKTALEPGFKPRYFIIDQIDSLDQQGVVLDRIKLFKPALGYQFHLRTFLIIWLMFLPLAIVQSSGWFTVIWTLLITYGIGMLFTISAHLNDPFGFDLEDIKLNRLAAGAALGVLRTFTNANLSIEQTVKETSLSSSWLNVEGEYQSADKLKKKRSIPIVGWIWKFVCNISFNGHVAISMCFFALWLALVVFLSWALATRIITGEQECQSDRFWCLYIPVTTGTTAYIGLGIFLLLGFWISDAYGRYRRGLFLWKVPMQRCIEHVALMFCASVRPGSFHEGDWERFLSFLAALPYATKQHLRSERNIDELRGILSEEDWHALGEAENFPDHCMNVINGYYSVSDTLHPKFKRDADPNLATGIEVFYDLFEYELAVEECDAMRRYPIPHAFTSHLRFFAGVWLMILPLAFVNHYGFLSFLFLLPVGYSIINLLSMGTELADPFGTDKNDIPTDLFCREIQASVSAIYNKMKAGPSNLVHASDYNRSSLRPLGDIVEGELQETQGRETVVTLGKRVLSHLPVVNPWSLLTVVVWSAGAVSSSYGLSFLWDEEQRRKCEAWCSPIDVDGAVLLEIGFALFLILSFRASDALQRYDSGADIWSGMTDTLRHLGLEMLQYFRDGTWHVNDKERLMAHMAQLPLALRDEMLGIERSRVDDKEGLLSQDDLRAMESSKQHVQHILDLLHAYLVTQDCCDVEYRDIDTSQKAKFAPSYMMLGRIYKLRKQVAQAQLIKRFPVVRSYTRHQRAFTALWLSLLPLTMTPTSGWLTILWAPLISYGILGLENIATNLMDPFGDDSIDLPVNEMAVKASAAVLDAAISVDWGCFHHVAESPVNGEPFSGLVMRGRRLVATHSLPFLSSEAMDSLNIGHQPVPNFKRPQSRVLIPTLFAHVVHSVPWWGILGVATWTTVAVVLSYVSRDQSYEPTPDDAKRWWDASITIDSNVGSYVSFAAFMLLGFYVNVAFGRYHRAGDAWGDDLRAACHALAAQISTFAPAGTWHEGDVDRLLAHIAAIPVALKMELRHDRNIVELKGLLSQQDIGRMHCATNMAQHCLDVVRSYLTMGAYHDEFLVRPFLAACKLSLFGDIMKLEDVIRTCILLRDARISQGFIVMLRSLLLIWFIILPFILAEVTGWFCILWVTIIGYGVIGMYSIAEELQQPFGTDLNDLDLDRLANQIVDDILFIQKNYRNGLDALVRNDIHTSGTLWEDDEGDSGSASTQSLLSFLEADEEKKPNLRSLVHFKLLLAAVPWWLLPVVAIWAAGSVGIAYVIGKEFPLFPEGTEHEGTNVCDPHFCSKIAIRGPVLEYIGFALFLLLGFRLYDSHWRYVTALSLWQDVIIRATGLLSNRTFESFEPGMFHRGDLERIAAHVGAFSVVTASKLRREKCPTQMLSHFMHAEDVARLGRVLEQGDYCLDVIRGYFSKADESLAAGKPVSCSFNETYALFFFINYLRNGAAQCEKMLRVPLPYGYVQHTRIFLVIWISLLPLELVESQGWTTIFWVVVIAYGLVGVEKWSSELADPFGFDLSDIPLGTMRKHAVEMVKKNLDLFRYGTESVIKVNRAPFPVHNLLSTSVEEL